MFVQILASTDYSIYLFNEFEEHTDRNTQRSPIIRFTFQGPIECKMWAWEPNPSIYHGWQGPSSLSPTVLAAGVHTGQELGLRAEACSTAWAHHYGPWTSTQTSHSYCSFEGMILDLVVAVICISMIEVDFFISRKGFPLTGEPQ